jgi:hypothetical protein
MGPNPYYSSGARDHAAQEYLYHRGATQQEREQYARQPGGVQGEHQRRVDEEFYQQEQSRRAWEAANSPAGSAGSYRVGPFVPSQPLYQASVTPTTNTVAAGRTRPRTGMVVVICLVVLALLGAAVFAVYKHATKTVTLAQMGVQDRTYVTWSIETDPSGYPSHVVNFNVSTANDSDQVRKVRFCARKEPGTTDNCLHYKVGPHGTSQFVITQIHARYGLDEKNTIGADARIVEIDGFDVRP